MKSIGPFLNRDFGGFDRARALFSNMPVGLDFLCDYSVYFNDFETYLGGDLTGAPDLTLVDVAAAACAGGATPTAAQVDTAIDDLETSTNLALKELQMRANGGIHVVKDSGATLAIDADAENGVLKLSSAATTDDDGVAIQLLNTTFLVKSGKKLWFEARVKVSDADQGDMFVGLANEIATNPEDLWAAGQASCGFRLKDGDATIFALHDDDTSAVVDQDLGVDLADDTFIRLGFRTDGGHIRWYVNRALVHSAAIDADVAAVTMCPAFGGISGNAAGTHTRSIDYVLVVQER